MITKKAAEVLQKHAEKEKRSLLPWAIGGAAGVGAAGILAAKLLTRGGYGGYGPGAFGQNGALAQIVKNNGEIASLTKKTKNVNKTIDEQAEQLSRLNARADELLKLVEKQKKRPHMSVEELDDYMTAGPKFQATMKSGKPFKL